MAKSEINWFAFMIMIMGVLVSIMSSLLDLDLIFVGGVMFGIGLSNLRRIEC